MEFNNTTSEQERYSPINTPIQSMVEDTKRDRKAGPLIGSIIIIFVFIIGGLYFWGSIITHKKAELEVQKLLQEQSQVDKTNTIETNLDAIDIE